MPLDGPHGGAPCCRCRSTLLTSSLISQTIPIDLPRAGTGEQAQRVLSVTLEAPSAQSIEQPPPAQSGMRQVAPAMQVMVQPPRDTTARTPSQQCTGCCNRRPGIRDHRRRRPGSSRCSRPAGSRSCTSPSWRNYAEYPKHARRLGKVWPSTDPPAAGAALSRCGSRRRSAAARRRRRRVPRGSWPRARCGRGRRPAPSSRSARGRPPGRPPSPGRGAPR